MNISYPDNLPVVQYKQELLEALTSHQVIIVEGDTGSGKTTQLPKFCLEFLADKKGVIGCTQPRRIAASTVADRVSYELKDSSHLVGYKIRFSDKTSSKTRIKFMTDGILLAETQNNPLLEGYDIIIVDEAHERSLNIDFLLGYLKNLLPKRPDLKVIITSATIDTKVFSNHFNNAPIISVEGRTYPVTVQYEPYEDEDETTSYLDHCIQSVISFKNKVPPGDILVFLPTEKDIRQCCEALRGSIKDATILPMFGRLQGGDQKAIFKSYNTPKIVVSTNVAETSVTVPGIRYVIDSGFARISQYNVRAKTTSLPITRISQASCNQRKGRCGRTGPGICLRLYSEEDFLSRDKFTLPEIKRANLANVILQMASLKLGAPLDFPFVESPLPRAVRDGEKLLFELGALTPSKKLTQSGRFMANLPIDPCISRIIIEANKQNCLKEIQIIASALAIQDPRVRPADKEQEADAAHKIFHHPHSDFLTILNIWNVLFEDLADGFSWSKLKKFCKAHFLSFQRMREWIDLHEQMARILRKQKQISYNESEASYESIHLALTSGYLRNVAKKSQDKLYQGAHNLELMIFPGSHLFNKSSQWIIAATFLETNRLYALTVANIEPSWLETTGAHLCKYSYSNPRWSKKSGQVIADERVSLFGLIIVNKRAANFGKQNKQREEAREIFIQNALLTGDISGTYSFLTHNLNLIKKWQEAEHKIRKNDIIANELQLIDFYKSRLPVSVYNRSTLNRFLSKSKNAHNKLKMSEQDVLTRTPERNELADFPPTIRLGSFDLQVSYVFSPGSENDGMTIHIPVNMVSSIQPDMFDWLVPGLLPQKIHLLLKGLPKSIRKLLVPLNNTVDRILDDTSLGQGNLLNAMEQVIFKHFKISINRSEWPSELPQHLTPRFAIVGDNNKTIGAGRSYSKLVSSLENTRQKPARLHFSKNDKIIIEKHKNQLYSDWNFEGLETQYILYSPQQQPCGISYPYLEIIQNKGAVQLLFTDDKHLAHEKNRLGMAYLYRVQFGQQFKAFKKYCSTTLSAPSVMLFFKGYQNRAQLVEDIIFYLLTNIFHCQNGVIHSKDEFQQNLNQFEKSSFHQQCQQKLDILTSRLRLHQEAVKNIRKFSDLDKKTKSYNKQVYDTITEMLDTFLPCDFINKLSLGEVESSDRLLQSIKTRTDRAHSNVHKELEKQQQYQKYLTQLKQLQRKLDVMPDECQQRVNNFKTLVFEYHVALFTPEIKTRQKVSPKILLNTWNEIQRTC